MAVIRGYLPVLVVIQYFYLSGLRPECGCLVCFLNLPDTNLLVIVDYIYGISHKPAVSLIFFNLVECHYLVAVEENVGINSPVESRSRAIDNLSGQGEFHSCVLCLAHVLHDGTGNPACGR